MKRIVAALVALLWLPTAANGEPLAALTVTNRLVRFDSVTPGTITSNVAVTGLATGDVLAGIDVRPADNLLYGFAVGSGAGGAGAGVGKIYTINLASGAATLAATLAPDPADVTAPTPFASVSGTSFGVDFNPVADRLRIVSDTGQSLRINVTSGSTMLDGPLAYAAADANAGTPAAVVAAAYTNSVAGAASTLLFDLDSAISALVTQAPPNDGTLNTTALTSVAVFADATMDISGQSGATYAVLDGVTLNTLNRTTGDLTEVGPIGTAGSIIGLAVLVPEPTCLSVTLLACAGLVALARRERR